MNAGTLWDISEDRTLAEHKANCRAHTGRELRDAGIERAATHADRNIPSWTDLAYDFLREYIKTHQTFMAEDVRTHSAGVVPPPPSERAWGGVIVRARKAGLISHDGYRKVSNAKAHCTPAAVWRGIKSLDTPK